LVNDCIVLLVPSFLLMCTVFAALKDV